MKFKRNEGKRTDKAQAKLNILSAMSRNYESLFNKAQLGFAAYPEYSFRWAQGAAFSVAKICRELNEDGLIRYHPHATHYGWKITQKGLEFIASHPTTER